MLPRFNLKLPEIFRFEAKDKDGGEEVGVTDAEVVDNVGDSGSTLTGKGIAEAGFGALKVGVGVTGESGDLV